MRFAASILSAVLLALSLSAEVSAHAAVAPALGVAGGKPARNNVQRPNNNCGNVNVAATIDSSTAVTAAADGTFTVTATDFNAGRDGSRSFSASVDASGAGKTFVAAQVVKNGNAAPTTVGSDQLTVKLPAGTKCAGGKAKNLCVVQFKSTAGFGNCVVVKQAGAAGAAAGANANAGKGANNAANNKPKGNTAAANPNAGKGANNANKGGNAATGANNANKGGKAATGANNANKGGNAATGANNANKGGNAAAAGGNNNDPQKSTTLLQSVIATGFAKNGQEVPTAGQVASLTSTNNFINFCATVPGKPITNGQQIKTGSCNPAPMGVIAATTNMPSCKFQFPKNGDTSLVENTKFTVKLAVKHLDLGHFTNAASTYYAAPQTVNAQGDIIGHTHVTIEKLTALDQTTPNDPNVFQFFKGVNTAAVNGVVTVDVDAGLPAGFYKISTIQSSSNHQPVLVAVAQHASLDDAVYFTVKAKGAAANNGANNGANKGAAANNGQNKGAAANNGQNKGAAANNGAKNGQQGGRKQRRVNFRRDYY